MMFKEKYANKENMVKFNGGMTKWPIQTQHT